MKSTFLLILIFTFLFSSAQVGKTCENPIVINSLPYTTTDDTANYADNYDPPTSGSNLPNCTSSFMGLYGNYYHSGNDVIYSYTPSVSGTIKIEIPNATAWTGIFVYTSCSNIGQNYAGCQTTTQDGVITIDNFAVTAGQTYYVLISSWSTPQTVSYTLNITNSSTSNLAVNDSELRKGKISMYPNPTSKELNFRSSENIVSASIYTIEGKKIDFFKVYNNVLSVESLAQGTYIIEFTDKMGKSITKVFTKK
ncbi:T9SS type A sorting domain-containing protein [Chryseobacterium culicis]|uniref:Por secretion system C-terminal sorting domain-containing protein n=1 Tax=Chryseobacterium culicis TaxID=680127 RepID=A0A1H6H252_CHRCI|nr:T9SS type A sorting domain-containing protein [Chryseobacterium culicis]SEH29779.1 Por secretion system C-terminal sorting domain-containing protein [Chryseobacterium culicis]